MQLEILCHSIKMYPTQMLSSHPFCCQAQDEPFLGRPSGYDANITRARLRSLCFHRLSAFIQLQFQNQVLLFVTSTFEVIAQRVTYAHFDTRLERKQLYVNIGLEDFARKGMNVNFYMNMTCLKCQSVISMQDLVSLLFL